MPKSLKPAAPTTTGKSLAGSFANATHVASPIKPLPVVHKKGDLIHQLVSYFTNEYLCNIGCFFNICFIISLTFYLNINFKMI